MNILKLQGLDGRLFDLVAPLVMNPAVLRQNNNYPFKTTRNHVWYIAPSWPWLPHTTTKPPNNE